ncbi:ADP-ribose pyrophosphatase [Mycolicibacterium celeriflavum]|uniref:ADP-ribose pyrophosphatase n=1 Tax=Mycolicibacterium celeriflavum TaxID=1249101 RepID=A0A1X0BS69_MYCCF|nr:NUDIX hydrolase [Mycolicibacterium celeriflavum]MCV7238883.1 NUDIX hydrolase [Mycolicibacterium celeriflavum]OBG18117.1 ADP-ribose pyrophosphatase [Mycolicibacterium celeriflavum]ORA46229.1 ADP-ribose pyrophosphatase [Mycolicibacterium celeriflavum]BBY42618.1 ADP-ribose pyrophosphatase [Mycolicibacterium celeriflavum]
MADHDFETVSSETLYVGNIFALRADEVRMPGGHTARREVVEHYGAVAVLAMDDDRNIALVHQYRHPLGRRLWELPAGLLDLGGEPPHLTAARELEEEAGLSATDWRVLVDLDSAPGFSDESVRVYLATGLTDVGRPEGQDEEADLTLRWYPLDEAVRMVLAGEIVNSLAVGGILAAHAIGDRVVLRAVDAPWPDRPTAFGRRKGHP